jgi:hypothetical protein
MAYKSIGAVPWDKLGPGDTVLIYWRPTAYHEKILVSGSGTADQPIRILGVPGPNGQLPVIDGLNATTSPSIHYSYAGTQDRGLLIVSPAQGYSWGYKPSYIQVEGLDFQDAYRGNNNHPNTFKDNQGLTRSYSYNAAAIFVERGEHIVISDCTVTGSGNGIFVASGDSEQVQSRDIVVEGCSIYGNGNVGRDQEHNIYTEAIGMVFQNNFLGRLRPGALGDNLKDRSAGTVIRYNWIEGGAHLLDLVDAQDSAKIATADPSYQQTLVYGNTLIDGPGDAVYIVHYGGDSGFTMNYRKGTLYFYNNTVVVQANQTGPNGRWRTILFQLDTNEQIADIRNNIFFCQAATPGATPTELTLMNLAGQANFGVNWVSPGWVLSRTGLPFTGTVTGTDNFLVDPANDPGFVDLSSYDLRLATGSENIDAGGPLDPAVADNYPVSQQYLAPQSTEVRDRGNLDLGAFEWVGDPGIQPTTGV